MLDAFMLFLTEKNNWILPGGTVLAALAVLDKKRGLWFLGAALLAVSLSDLLCHQVLKPWFARPRPCQELDLVRFAQICAASFSFPSNHAANSFTLATLFALAYRNSILLVYTLATLVAASRVYLEVHYPTDVLAGAVCGILIGYLGFKIFR
ncbi:MAG: phosphatase PAP2 family protein, partial [Nitrospinaceae bacterium]